MNVPIKSSYLLAVQRADFSGIFITSEGIREEKAFLFCRAKTNRFLWDTKDAQSIQYLEVLGDSLFSALQQAFSPTSASPRTIPFSRQSILYAFVFKGALSSSEWMIFWKQASSRTNGQISLSCARRKRLWNAIVHSVENAPQHDWDVRVRILICLHVDSFGGYQWTAKRYWSAHDYDVFAGTSQHGSQHVKMRSCSSLLLFSVHLCEDIVSSYHSCKYVVAMNQRNT